MANILTCIFAIKFTRNILFTRVSNHLDINPDGNNYWTADLGQCSLVMNTKNKEVYKLHSKPATDRYLICVHYKAIGHLVTSLLHLFESL